MWARTAVEELLAGIWSEVLGVEQVGVADELLRVGRTFAAGDAGDVAGARAALGMELPLRVLFEAPTVAGLAERVEQELQRWPGLWRRR